jgi:hypothetical protein
MANSNCLEGMQCPKCESFEPFYITALSVFTMYDDGTDEHSDVLWENDAFCSCGSCEFNGRVSDFKEKEKKPEPQESGRMVGASRGSHESDIDGNH